MRESSSPWRHLDPTVVLATLALTALGLLAIYSSTFAGLRAQGLPEASTMRRQLLNLGLGLVVMVAAMAVDYRRLQAWAGVVLGAVAVALGLVLTPLGSATNGAQSWFELGAYQVQPSEYAKVGTIVVLAAVFGARREAPGPRRLAAGLAAMALVCAEILLQPDFGTFMVFVAILFGVLLVSGVQLRWLLVLALVGVLGTVGMFKLNVLREYQKERLTAFIDPGSDDGGRGFTYNSRQALIAIGSGGVGGKGYLRGTQTNLQYVPEQKTDFIFTVIGEELGFAGAMALLALLGLLLWRGLRIAAVAWDPLRDPAGRRGGDHAGLPGLRQHGHDHRDHAHHRDPPAVGLLRRVVPGGDVPGRRFAGECPHAPPPVDGSLPDLVGSGRLFGSLAPCHPAVRPGGVHAASCCSRGISWYPATTAEYRGLPGEEVPVRVRGRPIGG